MHTHDTTPESRGIDELKAGLTEAVDSYKALKKEGTSNQTMEAMQNVAEAFVDFILEEGRQAREKKSDWKFNLRNYQTRLENAGMPIDTLPAAVNMMANVLARRLLEANQPKETAVDVGRQEVSSTIEAVMPEDLL